MNYAANWNRLDSIILYCEKKLHLFLIWRKDCKEIGKENLAVSL